MAIPMILLAHLPYPWKMLLFSNGRLDASGPAYKAIILNQQETLTVDAANQLFKLCKTGLPYHYCWRCPFSGCFSVKMPILLVLYPIIMACDSVVQVSDTASVPQALEQLGVTPDVFLQPTGLCNQCPSSNRFY